MTLPDSEIKTWFEKHKKMRPGSPAYLTGCLDGYRASQSLWYERMGKFAEWVRGEGFQYLGGIWSSYKYNRSLTTPELINEFLNQLNEGK